MLELIKARMERLVILGLEGRPLGRSMGAVVQIWAQNIAARLPSAIEEMDAPRLHAAFDLLEATCDRWPQPRHLLESMPPRPERFKLPPPREKISEESRAKLRAILAGLRDKTRMKS